MSRIPKNKLKQVQRIIASLSNDLEKQNIPANEIKKRVERSKCSKCEKGYMVKKSGKYGEFIGCSYYPYCKNTKRNS